MDTSNLKAGDLVRRANKDNANFAKIGQVAEFVRHAGNYGEGAIIVRYDGCASNIERDGEVWFAHNVEPVPLEVPASPFYVRSSLSCSEFKIDVAGLHYTATDINTGEVRGPSQFHLTRNIPGALNRGDWTLIDPPAPAVDPVTAAAAEVQRLLVEQQAAVKAGDEADKAAEKAAEHRRNIGKALNEAQRALDKANHDAAGVEFDGFKYGYTVTQLNMKPTLATANTPR